MSKVKRAQATPDDLIAELCQIQNAEQLAEWKRNREVTHELINAGAVAVPQLTEINEFDAANRLADWLMLLADDAEPILKAKAINAKGIALLRVNKDLEALKCFDNAIEICQQLGDELYAARVRKNRLGCYLNLARYDEALRDGQINDGVLIRLGDKRQLAMNCNNMSLLLFRMDRFHESLAMLKRSEALLLELNDRRRLATVNSNQGVILTSLNAPAEALRCYQLAKDIAEETGQTYIAAHCNYNLGYLHYVQGEYTRALDILNETRISLLNERLYVHLCDLTQSEIYLEMNMHDDALRFGQIACDAFESAAKPFEMAKALTVMAIAQSQLRDFKQAARLFDRARTMFQQQGNHVRSATIDLYRGTMYLRVGEYFQAHNLAERAYEAFTKEDVKPKAAFAQVVAARASLMLTDIESAVSAGLRGSQFDQFDVSQASAGLEAGHTSARNSGSKKTTVLPFSFSRESRLFSA